MYLSSWIRTVGRGLRVKSETSGLHFGVGAVSRPVRDQQLEGLTINERPSALAARRRQLTFVPGRSRSVHSHLLRVILCTLS